MPEPVIPDGMTKAQFQAEMASQIMEATQTALLYIGAGVAAGAVLLAVGLGIMRGIGVLSQMRAGVR